MIVGCDLIISLLVIVSVKNDPFYIWKFAFEFLINAVIVVSSLCISVSFMMVAYFWPAVYYN